LGAKTFQKSCHWLQVNSSQAVLRCEYPGRPRSVDYAAGGNKAAAAGREPVSRQDSGNVDAPESGAQQPNSFSSSEEGASDEGAESFDLRPVCSKVSSEYL
jgi:hypothetical protein